MPKVKQLSIELYKCVSCGRHRDIPRKLSGGRKRGHKKHMYCSFCKVETKFVNEGIV